jgi:hypothetical protein
MELKDYVSQTLIQIIEGVEAAQEIAKAKGAIINGQGMVFARGQNSGSYHNSFDGRVYQPIEFDVAITTMESDNAKGGFGIFVGPIGAGVQGQTGSQNSSQNNIKFSIPLALPRQN